MPTSPPNIIYPYGGVVMLLTSQMTHLSERKEHHTLIRSPNTSFPWQYTARKAHLLCHQNKGKLILKDGGNFSPLQSEPTRMAQH